MRYYKIGFFVTGDNKGNPTHRWRVLNINREYKYVGYNLAVCKWDRVSGKIYK